MTGTFTDAHAWARRAHLPSVVAITVLVASAATVLAASVIGAGDAHANGSDFRSFPRVGTPTTTFRVTFSAPFPTTGRSTDYTLEAVGPRRCPALFEFTTRPTRRGERVVMTLTPFDDIYFGSRRRWCRGSYVGYVWYTGPSEQVIGYFRFGVGRKPVSLER